MPLLRPEEEKLVLHDRAAKVTAEVVVLQIGFRLIGLIEEEIICVQRIAPKELEERAVKTIAATLGDKVDHRSLCLPIFRAEAVAHNAKFRNRIY